LPDVSVLKHVPMFHVFQHVRTKNPAPTAVGQAVAVSWYGQTDMRTVSSDKGVEGTF